MKAMMVIAGAWLIGSAAQAADPPAAPQALREHGLRVTVSADGGGCTQVGDEFHCIQFACQERRDPEGGPAVTSLWVDEWSVRPTGYSSRHIECPVPAQTLRVNPSSANVSAVLDAESPDCTSYGETVVYDPWSMEPYAFAGLVPVEATLLDPRYQNRRVTSISYIDNETGESSRENCHGGDGYRLYGGGFSILGVYRPFSPPDTDGSYYYDTCGVMQK